MWLTTVTDAGAPAPFPVWFVVDGDDIVVFSEPSTRRVLASTQSCAHDDFHTPSTTDPGVATCSRS